ncbi:MAG: hypothetical protein H0W57_08505 [Rubrobacteraceae bacterium]|nr:hypothetical protein [Rubrobacteraceae bacterium]
MAAPAIDLMTTATLGTATARRRKIGSGTIDYAAATGEPLRPVTHFGPFSSGRYRKPFSRAVHPGIRYVEDVPKAVPVAMAGETGERGWTNG